MGRQCCTDRRQRAEVSLLLARLRRVTEGRLRQRVAPPRRHLVPGTEATTGDVVGRTMEDLLEMVHPGTTEARADPVPEVDGDRIVVRIWGPNGLSEVTSI